jgi:hypothetical protein
MNKKIFSALFVASFLVVGTASAQMMGGRGMMGSTQNTVTSTAQSPAINTALQDIYKTQNVSAQNQINCSKVVDDQYEKLGDAVMGYGITEQQHTAMENMMGGESSATAKQAHINMGRSYIGCWANYNSSPTMMGMMNSTGSDNNYSSNYNSNSGMMGYYPSAMHHYYGGLAWFCGITILLVWSFLILAIIALAKWLNKKI